MAIIHSLKLSRTIESTLWLFKWNVVVLIIIVSCYNDWFFLYYWRNVVRGSMRCIISRRYDRSWPVTLESSVSCVKHISYIIQETRRKEIFKQKSKVPKRTVPPCSRSIYCQLSTNIYIVIILIYSSNRYHFCRSDITSPM